MTKDKKSDLEELKKDYKKLQKKYALPDFEKLNEDFQIEKAAESETDFLTREVRRIMAEKFSNYLRFIETILNPINAPMFVFSIIKTMGAEEKKRLTEVYKKLAKIEMALIELDVEFSEKKDVIFIKEAYKLWQEIKGDVLKTLDAVKKNWDSKFEVNKKGYFG